jgi:hypothetical protein
MSRVPFYVLKPDLRGNATWYGGGWRWGASPSITSDLGEADADCSDCGCHRFAVRTSCHIAGMWLQSKGLGECQVPVAPAVFVSVPLATPRSMVPV